MGDCFSCLFFNDLHATKNQFILDIFNVVGPQTTNVVSLALTLWIIAQGFGAIMQPASITQRLQNIVKTGIMAMIVSLALRPDNGVPLVNEWILDPLEDMGLRYGMAMLEGVKPETMPAAASNPYSQFAYTVEQQIFKVLRVPGLIMDSISLLDGIAIGPALVKLIIAAILMLPYLFIFGLVGAFMLEAMFKFVAIGIVAPILAPAVLFQPSRPFTVAGVRILVGAFFTMVFTGGAMGFTMKTVDLYSHKLFTEMCANLNENDQSSVGCTGPRAPDPPISDTGMGFEDIPGSETASGRFDSIANQNVVMMFIIGFASILLHLQAKGLASNISGANDGAGPAAATLAAMKGVAGGGAYYAMRMGFGAGGAQSSAQQMLRGEAFQGITGTGVQAMGQLAQQHGVIGGTALALARGFRFGADAAPGGGGGAGAGQAPAWSSPQAWNKVNLQGGSGAQRYSAGTQAQTGPRNRNG